MYDVPPEFQKYIDSFELEARNHGQRIDIDNLIIMYDNQLGFAFCGKCNDTRQDPTIQKIISINPNGICWDNAKELETLLFHELGHCVLGRGHVTSRLPNGDPKSIMIPDDLTIYAPCTSPIGAPPCDNYFKREYYLDELFDESTPIPWWAQ